MKTITIILLLLCSLGAHSQCDSLQTQLEIEQVNNKITVDFLSEKIEESDVENETLKCQLKAAKFEITKQKTLKWIAIIGGAYLSNMIFIYSRK